MNSHTGFKDRRSSSTVLPKVFLFLQIIVFLLVSYISYIISSALGVPEYIIYSSLIIGNVYFIAKIFLKFKFISKRTQFSRKVMY